MVHKGLITAALVAMLHSNRVLAGSVLVKQVVPIDYGFGMTFYYNDFCDDTQVNVSCKVTDRYEEGDHAGQLKALQGALYKFSGLSDRAKANPLVRPAAGKTFKSVRISNNIRVAFKSLVSDEESDPLRDAIDAQRLVSGEDIVVEDEHRILLTGQMRTTDDALYTSDIEHGNKCFVDRDENPVLENFDDQYMAWKAV